jgi:hypothetical protein
MPSLTRDELYALVWTEPIQKIAPRYNISDRGLGKLCARHGIPVPQRGWWAKKRAGQRVRRIPLPPIASGQSTAIVIEPQQAPTPMEPPPPPPPLAPEIAVERDPVNAIVVDENAKLTHPLVRDAAAELRSGRPDRDGMVRTPRGYVDVRVSKGSVSRALRVLQALFRALEPRGYTVAVEDGKTFISVLGESYRVFMKERLRRIVRDLTPEEHKRRCEGLDVFPYELVPTGELALHLDSWPSRAVADRKKARLEDLLNEFIELLVERAYADKAAQAKRDEEAARTREAAERRRQEEIRNRTEEARRDHFDELVEHWRLNRERRAFLAELRAAARDVQPGSEVAQWFEWAEVFIDSTDVVSRFRPSEQMLTLYHSGYSSDLARIREEGFRDPEPAADRAQRTLVGIRLRAQKPADDWMKASMEIQIHERDVVPFETTEPGYVPRTFCVPARVLNRILGKEPPAGSMSEEERVYEPDETGEDEDWR